MNTYKQLSLLFKIRLKGFLDSYQYLACPKSESMIAIPFNESMKLTSSTAEWINNHIEEWDKNSRESFPVFIGTFAKCNKKYCLAVTGKTSSEWIEFYENLPKKERVNNPSIFKYI